MFEFLDDLDETPSGSEARYQKRIPLFEADGKPHPHLRHYTHWLIHNCISHPLLGVLPNERAVEFHQISSNWLNRMPVFHKLGGRFQSRSMPKIPEGKRGWWLLHNVAAHIAIGLCPTRPMFAFHDWTAEKMDVPGWV